MQPAWLQSGLTTKAIKLASTSAVFDYLVIGGASWSTAFTTAVLRRTRYGTLRKGPRKLSFNAFRSEAPALRSRWWTAVTPNRVKPAPSTTVRSALVRQQRAGRAR